MDFLITALAVIELLVATEGSSELVKMAANIAVQPNNAITF